MNEIGVDRNDMKDTSKSYALELQHIVLQTLADAYVKLRSLKPRYIRHTDLAKDSQLIATRVAEVGASFLTVDLPNLGEWADSFLLGEDIEVPVGFNTVKGLPVILRPFWRYYEADLRPILNSPERNDAISPAQAELVRSLRTALLGLKKLEVPVNTGPVGEG